MEAHLNAQVVDSRGPAQYKWLTLFAACIALFMAILGNLAGIHRRDALAFPITSVMTVIAAVASGS